MTWSVTLQHVRVLIVDRWLVQVPVFEMGVDAKPAEIATRGLAKARAEDFDAVIVDTAGRLQVGEASICLPFTCVCRL